MGVASGSHLERDWQSSLEIEREREIEIEIENPFLPPAPPTRPLSLERKRDDPLTNYFGWFL